MAEQPTFKSDARLRALERSIKRKQRSIKTFTAFGSGFGFRKGASQADLARSVGELTERREASGRGGLSGGGVRGRKAEERRLSRGAFEGQKEFGFTSGTTQGSQTLFGPQRPP